jgi:tellurite resistance protein
MDNEGYVQLKVGELAALMGIQERPRLTLKQSDSLARTTEYAGFAVEPDARLTGWRYDWDDPVTVFPHAYEGEPDTVRYGGAACILRLGIEIAEADGHVSEDELTRIVGQIETGFQLNEHEKRRLEALKALLLKTGSDVARIGARLQQVLPAEGCRAIGRLLVAVAGIDGVITNDEIAALRRCYRALGLAPTLLESTLEECAPGAAESPVTVVTGRPGARGEAIPAPPGQQVPGLQLNRELIMQIMSETREVSIMLAEAMSISEADAEDILDGEPADSANAAASESEAAVAVAEYAPAATLDAPVPDGLPARYADLFTAITTMERWSRADADALAREKGHMLAGALEAINDWAFERLGTQLVYEDGDDIVVERTLLEDTNNS